MVFLFSLKLKMRFSTVYLILWLFSIGNMKKGGLFVRFQKRSISLVYSINAVISALLSEIAVYKNERLWYTVPYKSLSYFKEMKI